MRRALLLFATLVCGHHSAVSQQTLELVQWHRADDLSPYYQQVVREAAEQYIGDGVEMVHVVVWRGYYHHTSEYSPTLQYDSSAFSVEPLTLATTTKPEHFGFTRQ